MSLLENLESLCRDAAPEPRPVSGSLTRRETEVLQLFLGYDCTKEVAIDLGITEATIKTHMTRICKKLKTGSRHRSLVEAIRRGLIDLPKLGGGLVGKE